MKDEKKCFAYDNGKCKILQIRKCEGPECNFLKTKKEFDEGHLRALKRIKDLDEIDRRNILRIYYPNEKKILEKIQ